MKINQKKHLKKSKHLINFLIFLSVILSEHYLQARELYFLKLNEQLELKVSGQDQLWIENKKVIQVIDKNQKILVIGKSSGSCIIKGTSANYQIIVGNSNDKISFEKLSSLLRFLPWLEMSFENEKYYIEGHIKSNQDWLSLTKLNLKQWQLNAEVSNSIIEKIETQLNKELKSNFGQEVKIIKSPSPTVRVPKDEAEKNTAFINTLKQFGLKIEKDENTLKLEPLVKVKMTLAEVRKSELEKFGLALPNQYSSAIISTKLQNPLVEGWSNNVQLDLMKSNGNGRVLATPVLISKSGSEANFLAGGEIPIKMASPKVQDLIWKKYGIQLKVKPTVDHLGHIKMDLETEVSSLDRTQAVDGIPALLTNKIQASFDLEKTQTLVLSGLIKHIDEKTVKGWPGLIDLPILGQLFSSQDYQQNKTEMIVFVTPEIIPN